MFLCYGDLGWDEYDDEEAPRPGGCALNVAWSLAAAGAPAGLAGAVGEDGGPLLDLARRRGLALEHVQTLPGPTPRQPIRVRGGERLLRGYRPGVLAEHRPGPALEEALARAALVYVPVCEPTRAWAERARALRPAAPLALDLMDLADVDPAWVEDAVRGRPRDTVFCGLDAVRQAAWVDRLARWTRAGGAARVLVTLGAEGALLLGGRAAHRVRARPAAVVDTTGCGDAFAGTFLARASQGAGPRAALTAAARAAAAVAGFRGGFLSCQAAGPQS